LAMRREDGGPPSLPSPPPPPPASQILAMGTRIAPSSSRRPEDLERAGESRESGKASSYLFPSLRGPDLIRGIGTISFSPEAETVFPSRGMTPGFLSAGLLLQDGDAFSFLLSRENVLFFLWRPRSTPLIGPSSCSLRHHNRYCFLAKYHGGNDRIPLPSSSFFLLGAMAVRALFSPRERLATGGRFFPFLSALLVHHHLVSFLSQNQAGRLFFWLANLHPPRTGSAQGRLLSLLRLFDRDHPFPLGLFLWGLRTHSTVKDGVDVLLLAAE